MNSLTNTRFIQKKQLILNDIGYLDLQIQKLNLESKNGFQCEDSNFENQTKLTKPFSKPGSLKSSQTSNFDEFSQRNSNWQREKKTKLQQKQVL